MLHPVLLVCSNLRSTKSNALLQSLTIYVVLRPAAKLEQEGGVSLGEGEMTRQRSVPYNMEDTTSTERLLADGYHRQPSTHRSASDIRGSTPQLASEDRQKLSSSSRHGSRSHRSHSKKERSERRSDRSRSRSRSSHQNGASSGQPTANGSVRSNLLKEFETSQPLPGLHNPVSTQVAKISNYLTTRR